MKVRLQKVYDMVEVKFPCFVNVDWITLAVLRQSKLAILSAQVSCKRDGCGVRVMMTPQLSHRGAPRGMEGCEG